MAGKGKRTDKRIAFAKQFAEQNGGHILVSMRRGNSTKENAHYYFVLSATDGSTDFS